MFLSVFFFFYLLGGFEVLEDPVNGTSIHEEMVLDTLHHHPKTTSFETVGRSDHHPPLVTVFIGAQFSILEYKFLLSLLHSVEKKAGNEKKKKEPKHKFLGEERSHIYIRFETRVGHTRGCFPFNYFLVHHRCFFLFRRIRYIATFESISPLETHAYSSKILTKFSPKY